MNRILKTIALCLLLPAFTMAQNVEVGIMLGTTAYSGEITPTTNRFSTGENHPAFGLFARMEFSPYLAGRINFLTGKISGDDADAEVTNIRNRNLSFQSNINELAAILEINPLGNNGYEALFEPFVYGGISVFRFNPETNFGGQLVELQPLGTEGQGMPGFGDRYRLTQIAIPMGVGVKYRLTERLKLGIDFGLRKTFTDYLDDVSGTYVNYNELLAGNGELAAALGNRQGELTGEPVIVPTGTTRGNSDTDDWFYSAGLTLSYTFNNGGGNRRRSKKDFGCPAYIH